MLKFVFYSVLCYKSELSLFVNYRKVDFDLFCYILFSDPLSYISASQHCLTPYISCCSWSEFHLPPTHSLVTDGILVWSVTSFFQPSGQFKKKETLKKFREIKIGTYYRDGTCSDREFRIISLSSTGALIMSCMNYRLPLVWYSISSQTFASMSPVTDISILLVLHHSSGMFSGSDDINTASFTHHNKRKSHSIMSSDLGCHEY